MAKPVIDFKGSVIKADGLKNTEIDALTSDASEAHALNAVFDDTEVEAALDALAVKINAIIDALKA